MDSAEQVSKYISGYPDWRGKQLEVLRSIIDRSAPDAVSEIKWGCPVWSQNGLVCAISSFKDHVKINFFKGAQIADPKGLFNSGLESKDHRSINISQADEIDKSAVSSLVTSAIANNAKGT